VDGESSGVVHVSISIANDEIEKNVDTVGGAAGIKKRDCSHNKKKRPKSWVEKLTRKRKAYSNKKRQSSQVSLSSICTIFDIFIIYLTFLIL
jgi:hypothetical protein